MGPGTDSFPPSPWQDPGWVRSQLGVPGAEEEKCNSGRGTIQKGLLEVVTQLELSPAWPCGWGAQ